MPTQYLLDDVRRRTGDALRRWLAGQEQDRRRRRRRLAVVGASLAGGAVGLWAVWHLGLAPAPGPERAAQAPVPDHQRAGPLANPWGAGTPVVGERGSEVAAAASAVMAAPAAAAASAAAEATAEAARAAGPVAGLAALAAPGAREAVGASLSQLRGSARAADFAKQALAGRDAARLTAAWMAERECRQVAQWRLMFEWRTRATQPGVRVDPAAAVPTSGVHPLLRALLARCADMPDDAAVEAALAAAGFPATPDLAESTRRPLDVARAAALGDPLLLATVIDASGAEELEAYVAQRLPQRTPPASPEVLKAALWLASCRTAAAAGAAGASAAPSRGAPTCAEHPALWQACTQSGLCDARDLHDLLLRTMPADQFHATERLAQALAPSMGAGAKPVVGPGTGR
ncbi:MAG: hypothetical protein JNL30_07985 [Rubrivivax sp.]|nr:hypothetical protein [Rubrivivax sp.]